VPPDREAGSLAIGEPGADISPHAVAKKTAERIMRELQALRFMTNL